MSSMDVCSGPCSSCDGLRSLHGESAQPRFPENFSFFVLVIHKVRKSVK